MNHGSITFSRRDELAPTGPTIYTHGETAGVSLLAVAGVVSIVAVLFLFAFSTKYKPRQKTHIVAYLWSLMIANVIQAIGTIMNARWISKGGAFPGGFCSAQGGVKNAGNLGTALWSFVIAMHVFNLLFLRWQTTRAGLCLTLIFGWSTVIMIVTLGPTSIETAAKGPYFSVAGYWCWITDNYPAAQTMLEYFFEFMSAGLGFIIYMLVLLRVRGNLYTIEGKYRLRWLPHGERWQLSVGRDMIDSAMVRVVTTMIWYPVAYSFIIVPIALARLSEFMGHKVPFWATIVTDVIFNLTGLINTILFFWTRRSLPDTAALPEFTTPRKRITMNFLTPFVLPPSTLARDKTLPIIPVHVDETSSRRDKAEDKAGGVDEYRQGNEKDGKRRDTHTYGGDVDVPPPAYTRPPSVASTLTDETVDSATAFYGSWAQKGVLEAQRSKKGRF
ncbi:hypothetical protein BD410DRAFT_786142 [Rickenella mellea]|uniref:G protein-coupled receptor GPR1/2/3 C-terminal domain-containing protein n=1 Tax=Rickenella mellea TaxID=50990 RepID=A0A4Y7QCP5_9AGAM|nr:hypothetical protein BD410DRAFT_786142 [Rickenella mellea]